MLRVSHGLSLLCLALVGLSLFGSCSNDPVDDGPQPDCLPDEAVWESTISEVVSERCTPCHDEEPMFGAPISLIDYDELIEGTEGLRIVDLMTHRVSEGSMPPVGAPLPTLEERDMITEWASCGEVRVHSPVGLDVNRPIFEAPEAAPEGLEVIDVLADNLELEPSDLDRYVDIDFDGLVEVDMFIRRLEAVVDDERVVHHLTLRRGDPASGDASMIYLYAWAPGTGAFQFPDGGLRLRPEDNLRLQIHYNNGGEHDDVSDSSGVRLYVGPPEGREWIMADPGPGAAGFSIDPRSDGTVETSCRVQEDVEVLATLPHMHEIGEGFSLDLKRGSTESNLLALSGWSFETQLIYQLPLMLEADDELTIRCDFENPRSEVVRAGARTEDEMCFAFTYVTPPNANFCIPDVTGLQYEPGACIDSPMQADELPGVITDEFPEFDAEGVVPDGHWAASRLVVASTAASLLSVATFTMAAQLRHQDGDFELDAGVHVVAPVAQLREGMQIDVTAAGTLDSPMGPSTLTTTCGGITEGSQIGTVDGVPAMEVPLPSGMMSTVPLDITLWVFFEPA